MNKMYVTMILITHFVTVDAIDVAVEEVNVVVADADNNGLVANRIFGRVEMKTGDDGSDAIVVSDEYDDVIGCEKFPSWLLS